MVPIANGNEKANEREWKGSERMVNTNETISPMNERNVYVRKAKKAHTERIKGGQMPNDGDTALYFPVDFFLLLSRIQIVNWKWAFFLPLLPVDIDVVVGNGVAVCFLCF